MYDYKLGIVGAGNMASARGHNTDIHQLRGVAWENRPAAIGFTVAALSMIGIPLLTGFTAKFFFAEAAVVGGLRMWAAILALAAALKSDAVKTFIEETYEGAVVPLF